MVLGERAEAAYEHGGGPQAEVAGMLALGLPDTGTVGGQVGGSGIGRAPFAGRRVARATLAHLKPVHELSRIVPVERGRYLKQTCGMPPLHPDNTVWRD